MLPILLWVTVLGSILQGHSTAQPTSNCTTVDEDLSTCFAIYQQINSTDQNYTWHKNCENIECYLQCVSDAVGDCHLLDQYFTYEMTLFITSYRAQCANIDTTVQLLTNCDLTLNVTCMANVLTLFTDIEAYKTNGQYEQYREAFCNYTQRHQECLLGTVPVTENCTTEVVSFYENIQRVSTSYSNCGMNQTHPFFTTYAGPINCVTPYTLGSSSGTTSGSPTTTSPQPTSSTPLPPHPESSSPPPPPQPTSLSSPPSPTQATSSSSPLPTQATSSSPLPPTQHSTSPSSPPSPTQATSSSPPPIHATSSSPPPPPPQPTSSSQPPTQPTASSQPPTQATSSSPPPPPPPQPTSSSQPSTQATSSSPPPPSPQPTSSSQPPPPPQATSSSPPPPPPQPTSSSQPPTQATSSSPPPQATSSSSSLPPTQQSTLSPSSHSPTQSTSSPQPPSTSSSPHPTSQPISSSSSPPTPQPTSSSSSSSSTQPPPPQPTSSSPPPPPPQATSSSQPPSTPSSPPPPTSSPSPTTTTTMAATTSSTESETASSKTNAITTAATSSTTGCDYSAIVSNIGQCLSVSTGTLNSTDLGTTLKDFCADVECNIECYVDAVGECYTHDKFFTFDTLTTTVYSRAVCKNDILSAVTSCFFDDTSCFLSFTNEMSNSVLPLFEGGTYTAYRQSYCSSLETLKTCLTTSTISGCDHELGSMYRDIYLVAFSYSKCGPQDHAYFSMYEYDVACSGAAFFANCLTILMAVFLAIIQC